MRDFVNSHRLSLIFGPNENETRRESLKSDYKRVKTLIDSDETFERMRVDESA